MLDDTRWAARYQFLEELWHGRDRLLVDPELEALMRDGGSGPGNGSPAAIADLFDDLVPADAVRESVYVVIDSTQRVAEFAKARAGTTFVGAEEGAGLVRGGAFEVAVLHLPTVDEAGLELVAALVRQCRKGKTGVVIFDGEAAGGLDFDGASAFVDAHMRGARLYGLAQPQLTALYDFGGGDEDQDVELEADGALDEEEAYDRALERAERAWSDDESSVDEDDDVPIDFDNRLGVDPEMRQWVVVLGSADLGRGLTLVELPPRPVASSTRGDAEDSVSVRAAATQVHEARRQADQAAIERQQLLEQLEDAHERIAALEEARGEVADEGTVSARLDAALAARQSLEWELAKLRSELEKERGRPVNELEAEVAGLRAKLATRDEAPAAASPRELRVADPRPSTAPWLAELDRLLARVERGGIASMALHRSLSGLRRRISMGR